MSPSLNKQDKLEAYVGYSYGQSKDIVNGVRVSPAANYEWNQSLVANSPELAYSHFDLRHKFIGNVFYNLKVKEHVNVTASLIYIARSGSPFSFVYEVEPPLDRFQRSAGAPQVRRARLG